MLLIEDFEFECDRVSHFTARVGLWIVAGRVSFLDEYTVGD